MNNFKEIILFFWQLPQHVLAQILIAIYIKKIVKIEKYSTSVVYYLKDIKWGGVSLGRFILLSDTKEYNDLTTVKHEYGHSLQSRRWGLFYLIIVGLPSIIMNVISRVLYSFGKKEFALNYYNRWPENEADRLGLVQRKKIV